MRTTCQTECSARREVHNLYSTTDRLGGNVPSKLVCVLHHPNCCTGQRETKPSLHHLDESGGGSKFGWFFENLIPICQAENLDIEMSRRFLSTSNFLQNPRTLLGLAQSHQARSDTPHAYACARLACFLAWRVPRNEFSPRLLRPDPIGDRDLALEAAADALLILRGMDPRWSVPLAIDTVDRSILRNLRSRCECGETIPPPVCAKLMMSLGAFHRDFKDLHPASFYLSMARRNVATTSQDYGAIINHQRILFVGVGTPAALSRARDLRALMLAESDYAKTAHGSMNDVSWHVRALSDPDEIKEGIRDGTRRFFRSGAIDSARATPKRGTPVSKHLNAEFMLISAEADSRRGHQGRAKEKVREAVQLLRSGRFAPNPLAQPNVLRDLARDDPETFKVAFRTPVDLKTPRFRTSGQDVFSFTEVSQKVRVLLPMLGVRF